MKSNAIKTRHLSVLTGAVCCLCIVGCESFYGEKAAEIEADRTLRNLTEIKPVQDPNVPLPATYATPPRIVEQLVGGAPEWKLFYFARHQTPAALKDVIEAQFATRTYDNKGKASSASDYLVSSNPACNQIIVRCPTEPDVRAALELIRAVDVPPVQVRIDCLICELYADVTIDRETTIQLENILGEHITMGGKVTSEGLLAAFPGAALREVGRSQFGLKVGYLSGKSGHWLKALVDILESKGYVKIVMNPSVEVVNGKPATIVSKEHVPLQTISLVSGSDTYTRDQYVWIIDQLTVTPHVFADGSIALETNAMIAAKSTPEGVKQIPVLTKRQITNKENRIRHGESLVIGGIRKSERRDVVRGVPGLKDIPVLGLLFSSRDFEERAKETVFILTPTISAGGIPNSQMVEQLQRLHAPPVPGETLRRAGADPFGFEASHRQQQRDLLDAERVLLEAQQVRATARGAIVAAEERAATAEVEAVKTLTGIQQAKAEALRLKAEAERAKQQAEDMLKAAAAAMAAAEKAGGDATKIRAEAEKLAAEAQKAKTQADEKAKVAAEAEKKSGSPPAADKPKPPPGKTDDKSQSPNQK